VGAPDMIILTVDGNAASGQLYISRQQNKIGRLAYHQLPCNLSSTTGYYSAFSGETIGENGMKQILQRLLQLPVCSLADEVSAVDVQVIWIATFPSVDLTSSINSFFRMSGDDHCAFPLTFSS
jgi:hypothetical protein